MSASSNEDRMVSGASHSILDMSPIVLIPARMASTRLPGKPLADICGVPMIVQVWRRAVEAGLGRVVVAASEEPVAEAIRLAGGEAVMTDPDLPSGTDRVWAALNEVDPEGKHGIVVNLQGDLPTLDPNLILACAEPLKHAGVDMSTLTVRISEESEKQNPNVVKAVVAWRGAPAPGVAGKALYFTRATAPYGEGPLFHHIGIYGFRREALARFVALPPSPLEQREKLEQLRALEDGFHLEVVCVDTLPLGVDTPGDLERARALLATG